MEQDRAIMKPQSRFVLITGASTGIGYGVAKELIRRGYTVFGSVRKKEDADRVKSELGAGFLPPFIVHEIRKIRIITAA